MNADAAECARDRRQRADHFDLAGAADLVQRPGAVLAARPGDQRLRARTARLLAALRRLLRRLSLDLGRRRLGLAEDAADHHVGRAGAGFPGAADRAPQRLVRGFAGEEHAVADRLHQGARAPIARPATPSRTRRASTGPCSTAWSACRRSAFFTSVPNIPLEPLHRELDHRRFALAGKRAPERPCDLDHRQRRAADIGEQRGGARARRFLEHQIVARAGRADCRPAPARCDRSCQA